MQDTGEDPFLQGEELAEVVAAEFGARQFPPVVERIDIGLQPTA